MKAVLSDSCVCFQHRICSFTHIPSSTNKRLKAALFWPDLHDDKLDNHDHLIVLITPTSSISSSLSNTAESRGSFSGNLVRKYKSNPIPPPPPPGLKLTTNANKSRALPGYVPRVTTDKFIRKLG